MTRRPPRSTLFPSPPLSRPPRGKRTPPPPAPSRPQRSRRETPRTKPRPNDGPQRRWGPSFGRGLVRGVSRRDRWGRLGAGGGGVLLPLGGRESGGEGKRVDLGGRRVI